MADLTYSAQDTTFRTTLGVDADEVIIGNPEKPTEFEPHITFTKWNKENSLTIIPDKSWFSAITPSLATDAKSLEIGDSKIGFYYAPQTDLFKFGLILKDKTCLPQAVDGKYSWTFQLAGWEEFYFHHQGVVSGTREWDEVTNEWVIPVPNMPGHYRREIFQGSIFIEHKTKKDTELYKNGHCGVFLRPKFIDAGGKEEYADIEIKDGYYILSVPQDFFDNAQYPIKANDTFGMTDPTGSSFAGLNADEAYVTKYQLLNGTSGTLQSIHIYCVLFSGTPKFKGICFDDDGGSGAPLTSLAVTNEGSFPASVGWVDVNTTTNPTVTDQQYYYIGLIADVANSRGYYIAASGYSIVHDSGQTYTNPTANWSTTYTDSNVKLIAHAEYTAGGGGASTVPTVSGTNRTVRLT